METVGQSPFPGIPPVKPVVVYYFVLIKGNINVLFIFYKKRSRMEEGGTHPASKKKSDRQTATSCFFQKKEQIWIVEGLPAQECDQHSPGAGSQASREQTQLYFVI